MQFVKGKRYHEDDIREFEIDISHIDLRKMDAVAKALNAHETNSQIVIDFGGFPVAKTFCGECLSCGNFDSVRVPVHLILSGYRGYITIGTEAAQCLDKKCGTIYMTPGQLRMAINKIEYIYSKRR